MDLVGLCELVAPCPAVQCYIRATRGQYKGSELSEHKTGLSTVFSGSGVRVSSCSCNSIKLFTSLIIWFQIHMIRKWLALVNKKRYLLQ